MIPTIVVDVGNSRIKWGWRRQGEISESVSLPADEPATWQAQLDRWNPPPPVSWAISGVQPSNRDRLLAWIKERGDRIVLIDRALQLPLAISKDIEHPDKVGIDRLLNAVAANALREPNRPVVIVDVGSAVTVDLVDESGTFCGGVIFPGLRLMAQSLHDHTALLPLVSVNQAKVHVPAHSTRSAIAAGVFFAVAGGIDAVIRRYRSQANNPPQVYLTGGDAALLQAVLAEPVDLQPVLTLEGVRRTAEALP